MHFVDYFPHRELGIVYLQQDLTDNSIAELEFSIKNASSAKTHYFLNEARAAKIEMERSDRHPPKLNLKHRGELEVTNRFSTVIKGFAEDDKYVSAVVVQGHKVMIELAAKRMEFEHEVPLRPGNNSILVSASDLTGKTTVKTLHFYCDRRGPQIVISDLVSTHDNFVIKGSVTDDKELSSLQINGSPLPISAGTVFSSFKKAVPRWKILINAADTAGNETAAEIEADDTVIRHVSDYTLLAYLDAALKSGDSAGGSAAPFALTASIKNSQSRQQTAAL